MPWEVWLVKGALLKASRSHHWRFVHLNMFICGYWCTPAGEGRLMLQNPQYWIWAGNQLIEEHTSNPVTWRFTCMASIQKSADPQSLEGGGDPSPTFSRSTMHVLQSPIPTQTLVPSLSKSRKTSANRAPKRRNLPLPRRGDPSKS